jgi:hypothetical protein
MLGAATTYFASASGTTYSTDVNIDDLGNLYITVARCEGEVAWMKHNSGYTVQ